MRKDIALVALIVASLTLMVVPLSPTTIDLLLAVNMTLAVFLLMVAVYLKHPSDFSTFPSVILIGTSFRLALSIGTTRLILTEAEAGEIIETFGDFVVAGSVAVGLVIFLIITVVQFVVVTKGAERVAEVGARFALDALPGKQMSIDAEARAGNLTAEQAAEKRQRLDRDSRFFGAMDGAMKFVKGDAIAGIIIICINLIGGVAVGMSAHGYSFSEAIGIFSLLTVGDGLVAQIPALLMSLCAGIIVTRADGQEGKDLGSDISAEIIADPRVPAIGAPIVMGIGLIPGFPTAIFAVMAALMLIISMVVRRTLRAGEEVERAKAEETEAEETPDVGAELPASERIRLRIAPDLAAVLDLTLIERQMSEHLAMLYKIRGVRFARPIVDVCDLASPRSIVIDIDEVPIHQDTLPEGKILVIGQETSGLSQVLDIDDAQSWQVIDGIWLPKNVLGPLSKLEIATSEAEEGIACLTFRIYEQNLGPLFSQAVFMVLMEEARSAEPDLMQKIEEEIDDGALHKMFRYLIEDGVPLRPLPLLVSSIRYWLTTLDAITPVVLAECLRGSMKRQLCHQIAGADRLLGLALLDPGLEADIRSGLAESRNTSGDEALGGLALLPDANERLLVAIRHLRNRKTNDGRQIALVVAAELRRRLRNHLAANNIHLAVLAPHEIANEITTFPLDLVGWEAPDTTKASGSRSADRPKFTAAV
ncbi:FHIPEP family type III secretion protein [uncultured Tateyamaria sp.]|uniref:FHIPEP family type III secretion protein n=1 Tax=uncultured Tateyamaria sp. TaxID=455651 RepID=UPI002626B05E|nr:FHIPEP family type III secretion protein [uncultured Tateyamaria sp.]